MLDIENPTSHHPALRGIGFLGIPHRFCKNVITFTLLTGFLGFSAISYASSQSEAVSERNLASQGPSVERFPEGGDSVNRFNGALGYSISLGNLYPISNNLTYGFGLTYSSAIWQHSGTTLDLAADPASRFNAGVGWTFNFADLLAPSTLENPSNFWVYRSPDGKSSRFYTTLHDGESPVFNTYYSRDSTYRRLSINGQEAVVAKADGTLEVFQQAASGDWLLSSSEDVFGNSMNIDRSQAGQWAITDSHGRSHTIVLRSDPSGYYPYLIDRVELAAFNSNVATYSFVYSQSTLDRPPQDTATATAAQVSVPLLQSIIRPDGTSHDFEYAATTGNGVADSGLMKSVLLPTGGELTYTYQTVAFPFMVNATHTADVTGLATRSAVGSGLWSFNFSFDKPRVKGTPEQPREQIVDITYPDGHWRRHFFSVYVSGDPSNGAPNPSNFQTKEYGLPITKLHGESNPSLFTSVLIYAADGTLERTTQLTFARDACAGCFDSNSRESARRTFFNDVGMAAPHETVARADFNGLGKFRTAIHSSSDSSAMPQTTTIDYSYTMPATDKPWILGSYGTKTTTQNGEARVAQVCMDALTGQITRRRTLGNIPHRQTQGNSSQAANDLITSYEHDAGGMPSVTRYYGGDVQAVGLGSDLCLVPLPAQEQYAAYQTHQFGMLSEQGWLAADGSIFQRTYSAAIDLNTGQAITSAGVNDFLTTYHYDSMGRLLSATPPAGHGGAQTLIYSPADFSQSTPQPATTTSLTTDAVGSTLAERITTVDGFGRMVQVQERTSSGWDLTSQSFDGSGRLVSRTTPDGKTTYWLGIDAFGRPSTIRPPEGTVHDRTFSYAGRSTTETLQIGKSWDEPTGQVIETARSTTTSRDHLGRLIETRISDADGSLRTQSSVLNIDGEILETTIAGHLQSVSWTSDDLTDGRGFMVRDSDGSAITGYDAMGRLTTKDYGQGPIIQSFDRAGRLYQQSEGATGRVLTKFYFGQQNLGTNLWKGRLNYSFRYNWDVPHVADGLVRVKDTYVYRGIGGRMSRRITDIEAGLGANRFTLFTFRSDSVVDGLGRATQVEYPDCLTASNSASSLCVRRADRTLNLTHQYGDLISVTSDLGSNTESWIDQISYAPGGFVLSQTLGNGFVESRTESAGGRGRIESLSLTHPSYPAFYNSGDAVYDGKGRMVKLGDQRRISDRAYDLTIPQLPSDDNGPVSNPSSAPKDGFGMPTQRDYQTKNRHWPNLWDTVKEIYIYGPGQRRIWTRAFNDYEVSSYHKSIDTWHLVDTSGRKVRERQGVTHYTGDFTFLGSSLSAVDFGASGLDATDYIFVKGQRLGEGEPSALPFPSRTFYHHDIHGRLYATSDQSGNLKKNSSHLQ